MNPHSPRARAVVALGYDILRVAAKWGAVPIGLCGSVARGDDREGSDIDLFVFRFARAHEVAAHRRATQLVNELRELLLPHAVDVRGIPGWPLDPDFEATMRADAIDLQELLQRSDPRGP